MGAVEQRCPAGPAAPASVPDCPAHRPSGSSAAPPRRSQARSRCCCRWPRCGPAPRSSSPHSPQVAPRQASSAKPLARCVPATRLPAGSTDGRCVHGECRPQVRNVIAVAWRPARSPRARRAPAGRAGCPAGGQFGARGAACGPRSGSSSARRHWWRHADLVVDAGLEERQVRPSLRARHLAPSSAWRLVCAFTAVLRPPPAPLGR
jgi:hypothetical protein